MSNPKVVTVWGISESEETEHWNGMYDTKEEAIADGLVEYEGRDFWVVSGYKPCASSFMPDVDWFLEEMGNQATDECGEAAEDFPDVTKEAEEELETLLEAWAEKHCKITFYMADGKAEKIVRTQESPRD